MLKYLTTLNRKHIFCFCRDQVAYTADDAATEFQLNPQSIRMLTKYMRLPHFEEPLDDDDNQRLAK